MNEPGRPDERHTPGTLEHLDGRATGETDRSHDVPRETRTDDTPIARAAATAAFTSLAVP